MILKDPLISSNFGAPRGRDERTSEETTRALRLVYPLYTRFALHAPMPAQSRPMPNIAAVLKSEISRIARKEVRAETASTKKASSSHRTELLALKKRVQALEQHLRRFDAVRVRAAPAAQPETSDTPSRFSPKGLKSMRRRLRLSANDCGVLIGASGQSIYNWEDGKARPQRKYLAALTFLKTKSKKDVAARLEYLKTRSVSV